MTATINVDALPTASGPAARRRLARLFTDRIGRTLLLIGLVVSSVGVQLLGPALVGIVVDAVADVLDGDRAAGDARSLIGWVAVAFGGVAVVGAVLTWLGTVQAATLGESALAELRTEVFDHTLEVDVDRIERGGTGDLVARLGSDVDVLAQAVQRTVPSVLLASVEIGLTAVALLLVDVRLALVAIVAGVPSTAAGVWWYARHAPGRYRIEREAVAELSDTLVEGYAGRRTLTAFWAGPRWRRRAIAAGDAGVRAQMSTAAARNVLRPSVRVSLACSLAAVIVVGAALVDDGAVTIGAVSAVALYVIATFEPIGVVLEEL
ncbi:MAG: ABC transporter transmembrane domain-containing protein, partial [Actinomycetota bacterium]